MKAREETWVMPVNQDPSGNVWVMIAESRHKRGLVKVLRVFSTQPTDSEIDYQKKAFSGDPKDTEILLHEVAVDYYDEDEMENAGC